MYTLYSIPGTCSSGITALLEKLGVAYEVIKRDDVSNYTEIVPTNAVPALKLENGSVITEGAAIALYLLEKHENNMVPSDLDKKAEFLKWFMFNYATLHPAYGKMFTITFKVDMSDAEKAKLMPQLANVTSNLWAILDKRLATQKFIFDDQPSIIDYLVAIYSSWNNYFPEVKINLGANVERLVSEVSELPEFRAAYAKEGKDFSKAA